MPTFGTEIKPVSIVAFSLTCLSALLVVIAISLTSWWSVVNVQTTTYHGVWRVQKCTDSDNCESEPATELESGQEALVVSKVFATFTAFLSVAAVICHIIYAIIRISAIRTATIFMLGSAALFGLLSVFVFLGFYHTTETKSTSIGGAFYLFVFASILCLVAGAFTTWASVRKATGLDLPDAEAI